MRRSRRSIAVLLALIVAIACHTAPPATRVPNSARGRAAHYDPARDLGPLFHDVQMARVFDDSKTFVDAVPRERPADIAARYAATRATAGFDLKAFVARYFTAPPPPGGNATAARTESMEAHIASLWQTLARAPDRHDTRSSLIPLPRRYVVPGGRFREIYYWDSYFTMLGLVESGRLDLVKDMLDNFAYLVETAGHVPNGNRTYYLSRSQPPFFGAMVALFADRAGTANAVRYLDALEKEYAYWMDGASTLAPAQAFRRVVRLADGSMLNRYWDDRPEPRPESYREDVATAERVSAAGLEALYRNIRATAESGWDFSSRWLRDPRDLTTLETTDLVPVDLNSLLFETERIIAKLRSARQQTGDQDAAQQFIDAADRRRRALLVAAYDPTDGFFFDVRWRTGERVTDRPTMAAAAPLLFGLATTEQGRAVAARLERDFLRPGGFVTTTIASGQQWDAPNGWAPLEWMGIEGVRRYGRDDLATDAATRWLALNRRTYQATGKMMEKYDVSDLERPAGGGEYPGQDGFGWTNGVALALSARARFSSRVVELLDRLEGPAGPAGHCRQVGQDMRRGALVVLVLFAGAACESGGSDAATKSAWEPLPLGTKADFRDIYFADAQHGWIAGGSYEITGGLVGRTSDGGKTWRYVSDLTQREGMTVQSIRFFDTARGIAATSSGSIFSTIDAGENWTVTDRRGRVSGLSRMFLLDERRGWAAGTGDVIRTDDAGEHWVPASSEYVDTSYRSPIRAIQFLDDSNGWVAGMQSYLARTTDAGATWEPILSMAGNEHPSFWDLSFVDRRVGWVVGEEGFMLSTTDGGITWTPQSTGLKDAHSAPKLETIPKAGGSVTIDAGDRTPGFTVSAVRFVDRNRGWITGFYPNFGRSLILRTENGGATWTVDADIAGEELYTLFIQGGQTAWAIGARTREGSQAIYRRTVDLK